MAEHRGGSGNFADNPQKASEAGKKGGQSSGGGNFKNDREKASEAGKKAAKSSRRPFLSPDQGLNVAWY